LPRPPLVFGYSNELKKTRAQAFQSEVSE
jgi:hypothetical protein